jgi:hypothetical protein
MKKENISNRKRGRPKGSKNRKKHLDETHFLLMTELVCILNMALYSKLDSREDKQDSDYQTNSIEAREFHVRYLLCEVILDLNKQIEKATEYKRFLESFRVEAEYFISTTNE